MIYKVEVQETFVYTLAIDAESAIEAGARAEAMVYDKVSELHVDYREVQVNSISCKFTHPCDGRDDI